MILDMSVCISNSFFQKEREREQTKTKNQMMRDAFLLLF